jgi:hypothetical protein
MAWTRGWGSRRAAAACPMTQWQLFWPIGDATEWAWGSTDPEIPDALPLSGIGVDSEVLPRPRRRSGRPLANLTRNREIGNPDSETPDPSEIGIPDFPISRFPAKIGNRPGGRNPGKFFDPGQIGIQIREC